jgi:hypothetical protein
MKQSQSDVAACVAALSSRDAGTENRFRDKAIGSENLREVTSRKLQKTPVRADDSQLPVISERDPIAARRPVEGRGPAA